MPYVELVQVGSRAAQRVTWTTERINKAAIAAAKHTPLDGSLITHEALFKTAGVPPLPTTAPAVAGAAWMSMVRCFVRAWKREVLAQHGREVLSVRGAGYRLLTPQATVAHVQEAAVEKCRRVTTNALDVVWKVKERNPRISREPIVRNAERRLQNLYDLSTTSREQLRRREERLRDVERVLAHLAQGAQK
jgi:hypothetical protein